MTAVPESLAALPAKPARSVAEPRAPIPALTSLRFFAAMEVVLFHSVDWKSLPLQSGFLMNLLSCGYEAVTFFFVLSGFILTYVYSGARDGELSPDMSLREFFRARLARVAPAYWFALLLALPAFLYSGLMMGKPEPITFAGGLLLAPLFLQAWWPPTAVAWNMPAWSVSVEAFLYLAFPWLRQREKAVSWGGYLVLALVLAAAVTILRTVIYQSPGEPTSFSKMAAAYFPLFHLPPFMLGIALGRAFLFGPALPAKAHAALFFAGLAGVVLLFGFKSSIPGWATSALVLSPLFAAVVYGAARPVPLLRPLSHPALIFLGEISYSIYILHVPLHFWWRQILKTGAGGALPAAVQLPIYLGLVLLGAALSYRYVERPLRYKLLGHPAHRAS